MAMAMAESEKLIVEDVYDYIKELLSNASYLPGDTGPRHDDLCFDWVDKSLIEEGNDFPRQHFTSVTFSLFVGAFMGQFLKSVEGTVTRTGNVYSIRRQIDTGKFFVDHMMSGGDLLDKNGTLAQNLLRIRKLHATVPGRVASEPLPTLPPLKPSEVALLKAWKEDMSQIPHRVKLPSNTLGSFNPPVFMSQMDMVLVQFVVIGALLALPETGGLSKEEINSRGFQGYIQNFGIVTQYLGVDDKWNICREKEISARRICFRLWEDVIIPSASELEEFGLQSLIELTKHGRGLFIGIRIHLIMFLMLYHLIKVDGKATYRTLNKWEVFLTKMVRLIFYSHRRFYIFRIITSAFLKILINLLLRL